MELGAPLGGVTELVKAVSWKVGADKHSWTKGREG